MIAGTNTQTDKDDDDDDDYCYYKSVNKVKSKKHFYSRFIGKINRL